MINITVWVCLDVCSSLYILETSFPSTTDPTWTCEQCSFKYLVTSLSSILVEMNVVLLTSALLDHLLLGEQRACIPHGAFRSVFSTVEIKHLLEEYGEDMQAS